MTAPLLTRPEPADVWEAFARLRPHAERVWPRDLALVFPCPRCGRGAVIFHADGDVTSCGAGTIDPVTLEPWPPSCLAAVEVADALGVPREWLSPESLWESVEILEARA